jgi:hypothetical protein
MPSLWNDHRDERHSLHAVDIARKFHALGTFETSWNGAKEKPPPGFPGGGLLVHDTDRSLRHAVVRETLKALVTSATLGSRPCFWR